MMALIGKIKKSDGSSTGLNIAILLVLIIIVLLAWKIGSPLVKSMIMATHVEKLANYDTENRLRPLPEYEVRQSIITKGKGMGIPLNDENIEVNINERIMKIIVKYKAAVNLFLFQFDWPFVIEKETERFVDRRLR